MAKNATILGKVSITPKGAWDQETAYERLDLVSFIGGSFLSLTDNNTAPLTDATKWMIVVSKGPKGDTGETGERGSVGPKGDPGDDFRILGYYETLAALEAAVSSPAPGDAYGVGTSAPYTVYVWDGVGNRWVDNGSLQGPAGSSGKSARINATTGTWEVFNDDTQQWVTTDYAVQYTVATPEKEGLMSGADKAKVDKIRTDGDGTKALLDNGEYGLIGEDKVYILPSTIATTSETSTSEELFAAWGGKDALLNFVKNFDETKTYVLGTKEGGFGVAWSVSVNCNYTDDDNHEVILTVPLGEIEFTVSAGIASVRFTENNTVQPLNLDVFTGEAGTVSTSVVADVERAYDKHINVGLMGGILLPLIINKNEGGSYYIVFTANNSNGSGFLIGVQSIGLETTGAYTSISKGLQFLVGGEEDKFLTEAGTYAKIPLATSTASGLLPAADKKKLDRVGSRTTATSVANLDVTYETILVTLSNNDSLSANLTGDDAEGLETHVFVLASGGDRTITIPTTGNYLSMCGSSYTCPAGKWVEFSLKCVAGIWHIAKLEQE